MAWGCSVIVRYICDSCGYRWTRNVRSREASHYPELDRPIAAPDCEACAPSAVDSTNEERECLRLAAHYLNSRKRAI